MRARGAEATDIVVLVVAADDGVMPQTIEALDHARAAEVPIVVAHQQDRPRATPTRSGCWPQLAERGLVPESWGGDTIVVEVSALQNIGIDELLDNLLVVAELEDLRANPDGRARGVVLEANLDVGRGPVATVLVAARHAAGRRPARGRRGLGPGPCARSTTRASRSRKPGRRRRCRSSACPTSPTPATSSWSPRTTRPPATSPRQREHCQRVAGHGRIGLGDGRRRPPRGHLQPDPGRRDRHAQPRGQGRHDRFARSGHREPAASSSATRSSCRSCCRGVGGITENDIQLAAASERHDHRLQRAPGPQGPRAGRGRGRRDPHLRDHLQPARGHRERHGRHARPRVRRGGHRRGRGPRDLPGARASARSPAATCSNGTITRGSKVRFLREGTIIWKGTITSLQAVQGRRRARSRPASSAASASPTSRTSSPATSSRPTTSARSPAPDRFGSFHRTYSG